MFLRLDPSSKHEARKNDSSSSLCFPKQWVQGGGSPISFLCTFVRVRNVASSPWHPHITIHFLRILAIWRMYYPQLPVCAFIASALVLFPLPSHWRSKNVATLSLILWLFLMNLIYGLDSLVWADNARPRWFVWCDISGSSLFYKSFYMYHWQGLGFALQLRNWWSAHHTLFLQLQCVFANTWNSLHQDVWYALLMTTNDEESSWNSSCVLVSPSFSWLFVRSCFIFLVFSMPIRIFRLYSSRS